MIGAACRQKSVFDAKSTSCGRGPSSELTPTASVAAFGHVSLQAASRDAHFAHFCEGRTGPSLHPPHRCTSANLTAQK